jgi:uncharacterized membrane-anchored protein
MTDGTDTKRSVTELLVALTGPVIWFAHFGGLYALQGFACGFVRGGTAVAPHSGVWAAMILVSAAAVGALALLLLYRYRASSLDRSDANTQQEWSFLHYLQFAITGLALAAVLWTTLAAFMVPPCTPVFAPLAVAPI